MVQQTYKNRWFPREGDLVAVPPMKIKKKGIRGNCSYGIILGESPTSDFKGVWYDVLFDSVVQTLHIQVISPLCDKEGRWLSRSVK